jgi:hypothetical protein
MMNSIDTDSTASASPSMAETQVGEAVRRATRPRAIAAVQKKS